MLRTASMDGGVRVTMATRGGVLAVPFRRALRGEK